MLEVILLDSPPSTSKTTEVKEKPANYYTGPEWESRDAYVFVVSRLGKYLPWDPRAWPDEVKDEGCRCNGHSFKERLDENGEYTNVWVCTQCEKPKPLMSYVMWCCECGVPYVVRRTPDRIELCRDCGG